MENCAEPIALQDHDYCKRKRVSKRRVERAECPCCRDDQVRHHSAPTANPPQKRKRTSVSCPSSEHPEVVNHLPSLQPSASPADVPGLLDLVPTSRATIPPDELPLVSKVSLSPQSSSAPLLHDDDPVRIHNHSVEDYQKIYHEVVDHMLHYKSGRVRPYSLELGRRIKQKLWERLNRPSFTSSVGEDGLVSVDASYGVGIYPPQYDVDTLGEPKP